MAFFMQKMTKVYCGHIFLPAVQDEKRKVSESEIVCTYVCLLQIPDSIFGFQ